MGNTSLNRPKRATNAFDAHKTTFTGETLTATKLLIPLEQAIQLLTLELIQLMLILLGYFPLRQASSYGLIQKVRELSG